jgi:hypothetical protein
MLPWRMAAEPGGRSVASLPLTADFPDAQGKCREFPAKRPIEQVVSATLGLVLPCRKSDFPAGSSRDLAAETQGSFL